MAEVAPNLFVSRFPTPGKVLVVQRLDRPRALVVAEADWDRLDAVQREALCFELTRENAEAGQRKLEEWLAGEGRETPR